MSPATVDTIFRALTAAAAILGAASPLLVAVVVHYLRRADKAAAVDDDDADKPAAGGPTVADATVQGSTLQLEMWGVIREQLRLESEARLRAEVALDLAEAERDLYRGALEAADMPLPSLIHPSHREDHHG